MKQVILKGQAAAIHSTGYRAELPAKYRTTPRAEHSNTALSVHNIILGIFAAAAVIFIIEFIKAL